MSTGPLSISDVNELSVCYVVSQITELQVTFNMPTSKRNAQNIQLQSTDFYLYEPIEAFILVYWIVI